MSKEAYGIQIEELNDARKGAIYFLSQLQLEQAPSFNIGLVDKFLINTEALSDLKSGCELLIKKTSFGTALIDKVDDIKSKIQILIQSFFDKILEKAKEIFGSSLAGMSWLSEFVAWGISNFAGSLANVIPCWGYVKAGMDLYSAVKTSVTNIIKLVSQVYSGYGVNLLSGHASIIAETLSLQNGKGIAQGIKDFALKTLDISLQAAGDATAGIGNIIGIVTDILSRIVAMISYCIQRFRIKAVINQAQQAWKREDGIKTDHEAFVKWFRFNSVITPIVPCLVLHSGYVANPLRFLCLLREENEIISQREFDKGTAYITTLKTMARDQILNYREEHQLQFTGKDGIIKAMMNKVYEPNAED